VISLMHLQVSLSLYKLVRSDGLVAPLLAENGNIARAIIAGHGSADRPQAMP